MKEIEFKTIINKDEYQKLLKYFNIKKNEIIEQTNYYFDTLDLKYFKNKEVIRIREKNNHYFFTRKTKGENIYTNNEEEYEITKEKYEKYKKEGLIINNYKLELITSLKTKRAEINYENTLIAIDLNEYQNKIDYELEMEVTDIKEGELKFNKLLNTLDIKQKEFERKINRAFKNISERS